MDELNFMVAEDGRVLFSSADEILDGDKLVELFERLAAIQAMLKDD